VLAELVEHLVGGPRVDGLEPGDLTHDLLHLALA
jgi:hypothetical protein